jgi:hypothetical protein
MKTWIVAIYLHQVILYQSYPGTLEECRDMGKHEMMVFIEMNFARFGMSYPEADMVIACQRGFRPPKLGERR